MSYADGYPDHERLSGAVRHDALGLYWYYTVPTRVRDGVYEGWLREHMHCLPGSTVFNDVIPPDTDVRWPNGWIQPDGQHAVLYTDKIDVKLVAGTAGNWGTPYTIKASRTQPTAERLGPSNDVIATWYDGGAFRCTVLAWNGAEYVAGAEHAIATGATRIGGVDCLPDGRLLLVVEQKGSIQYAISADVGESWSDLTTVCSGIYPAVTVLRPSYDALVAYADHLDRGGIVYARRLAWNGVDYTPSEETATYESPWDRGLNSVDAVTQRDTGHINVRVTCWHVGATHYLF